MEDGISVSDIAYLNLAVVDGWTNCAFSIGHKSADQLIQKTAESADAPFSRANASQDDADTKEQYRLYFPQEDGVIADPDADLENLEDDEKTQADDNDEKAQVVGANLPQATDDDMIDID